MDEPIHSEEEENDPRIAIATPSYKLWQQWTTVLHAKNINHDVMNDPEGNWLILLQPEDCEQAEREITLYHEENQNWPPKENISDIDDPGFSATAFFTAVILWFAFFFTTDKDSYLIAGSADSQLILSGEYWRCLTALFLHGDLGHILSNVICIYIFAAALERSIGAGFSIWIVLLGGILGNLTNAGFYHDQPHNAIGASTAVFAALASIGVIRAYERFRSSKSRRWRIKPIIAIVCIFSMIGVSTSWTEDMRPSWEGNIDYMAHFCGFLWGAILALFYPVLKRFKDRDTIQIATIILACVVSVIAWLIALN